jgi:MFS family permease
MMPFILLLGLVSLLADVTYEGARSVTGPFLAFLGASGAVVGTAAGLGEFLGYAMRLVCGKIADRTQFYWGLTFIGYASNLIVVPLLAFAHRWEVAATLIVLERVGKGIRTPARDAMLSYATKSVGRGFGFGIHEAMDRCGALIGPLVVLGVITHAGSLRTAFLWLGIPALMALGVLYLAKKSNPHPQIAEERKLEFTTKGFSRPFWLVTAASSLIGAGYVDFALIAYHFQKNAVMTLGWIPLFYMFAMIAAVVFSLVGGKLFDFSPRKVVLTGMSLGVLSVPCVFWGGFGVALMGMVLWGLGLGMQGSSLRSCIAHLSLPGQRGAAYGTFGVVFGLCWFLGSVLVGELYDHSITLAVVASVLLQIGAFPIFSKVEIPA